MSREPTRDPPYTHDHSEDLEGGSTLDPDELIDGAGVSHSGELADAGDASSGTFEEWGITQSRDLGPDPNEWTVTKDSNNPVFSPASSGWDSQDILSSSIIKEGDTYKMIYSADDGTNIQIGLAKSTDLVSWSRDSNNPVLTSGYGGGDLNEPDLLKVGDTNYLFYHDEANGDIGYATSTDLINWSQGGSNPVLTTGAGGNWDDTQVTNPNVVYRGGLWQMLYEGSDGSTAKIGMAAGGDPDSFNKGVRWTNPIIGTGGSGADNESGSFAPMAVHSGQMFHIAYRGKDSSGVRRILATHNPAGIVHSGNQYFGLNSLRHRLLDVSSSDWDSQDINNCDIWKDGDNYEILYVATDGSGGNEMGHATVEIGGAP